MITSQKKIASLLRTAEETLRIRALEEARGQPRFPLSPERLSRHAFVLHEQLIERFGDWSTTLLSKDIPVSKEQLACLTSPGKAGEVWREAKKNNEQGREIHVTIGQKGVEEYAGPILDTSDLISYRTMQKEYRSVEGLVKMSFLESAVHKLRVKNLLTGESVLVPIRVGQRIAPVIMRAFEKGRFSARHVAFWERLLQRLQEEVWCTQTPAQITISWAPSDFLSIGEHGETGSCFRLGGARDPARYFLAACVPNSFMLFVLKDGGKSAAARAFGVACPGRFALLTNFYLLTERSLRSVLLPAIAKLFELQEPTVGDAKTEIGYFGERSLYGNADSVLYTSKGEETKTREICYSWFTHSGKQGIFSMNGTGPYRVATVSPSLWTERVVTPVDWPCRYDLWQLTHAELLRKAEEEAKSASDALNVRIKEFEHLKRDDEGLGLL